MSFALKETLYLQTTFPETDPSACGLTTTVSDVLLGKKDSVILQALGGNTSSLVSTRYFLAAYIANGFFTLEEGIDQLYRSGMLEFPSDRRATFQWLEYINSSARAPFTHNRVLSINFPLWEEVLGEGEHNERAVLEAFFPDLAGDIINNPEYCYRYVNIRERDCANRNLYSTRRNIFSLGIDHDLNRGWTGVWAKRGKIWGGGLDIEPKHKVSYLLVYRDPQGLLDGPGFYDEGALNFMRLVLAGKTLKDLLIEGAVLEILP